MEEKQPVYEAEAARAFIENKFREQGDFLQLEVDLAAMVATAQEAEQAYLEKVEQSDSGEYDDDEAYEQIRTAMDKAFPDLKMYLMRFTDDYLDFSEEYLESIGMIEWE